ncbi:MAG: hypothetical protein P1P64_02265 [Treponemataceae bacterium]
MKFLRKLFFMSFFLYSANFALAKDVVFYCVQNLDASENAFEITIRVEDFIFDYLFDSGLVVSNLSAESNELSVWQNVETVKNALENQSEYILIVNLTYDKNETTDKKTNKKFAQVEEIQYSLFSLEKNALVFEKNKKIAKSNTKNDLLQRIEKANNNIMRSLVWKLK